MQSKGVFPSGILGVSETEWPDVIISSVVDGSVFFLYAVHWVEW